MNVVQRDQFRASDDDRERVAAILRDAHAEGRLTRDEFDERLESTYAARTYHDLNSLLADLPASRAQLAKQVNGSLAPNPGPGPIRQKARRAARTVLNAFWWIYAAVVTVNVVIWGSVTLATPESPPFWPIFVAGPWGAILLFAELAYRASDSSNR